MPELPEAEMVRRNLEANCLGKGISDVIVRDDRILDNVDVAFLARYLDGRRFTSTFRHGKRIFLKAEELQVENKQVKDKHIVNQQKGNQQLEIQQSENHRSKDLWLTIHLGMTGWIDCLNIPDNILKGERSVKSLPNEPPYTRLLIRFGRGEAMAYTDPRLFGRLGLTKSPEEFIRQRYLGPDALKTDFDEFSKGLRKRKGCIKSILLDQGFIAGLGNLYADEVLFQAGINPQTKSCAVNNTKSSRLFGAIQEVLNTAISSSSDFNILPGSYLLPHRHLGGRCPKDGSVLKVIKVNGRTTYFCPEHQG